MLIFHPHLWVKSLKNFHFWHSSQTIFSDFFFPEILDIAVDNDIAVQIN